MKKIYELRKFGSHKKHLEEFDEIPENKEEKTKYIPPMSHPWKLASFMLQVKKAHNEHIYT